MLNASIQTGRVEALGVFLLAPKDPAPKKLRGRTPKHPPPLNPTLRNFYSSRVVAELLKSTWLDSSLVTAGAGGMPGFGYSEAKGRCAVGTRRTAPLALFLQPFGSAYSSPVWCIPLT